VISSPLRVLGIDPGSLRAGWALVAGSPARPELVGCGEIVLAATWSFERRLAVLHEALVVVVTNVEPTHAAVEAPFHGVSARAALQLAHARGVMLAVLGAAHVPVTEYSPATIKKAVTGNGRAEKGQVGLMVRSMLRRPDPALRNDVSDAAAAALCHLYRNAFRDRLAAMPGAPGSPAKGRGPRVSMRGPSFPSGRGEPG
jgi:crossover junction endodeoxyribonuclease RuvC